MGDKVLLRQPKKNKTTSIYDPVPYTITEIHGNQLKITRNGKNYLRNSSHVRLFYQKTPSNIILSKPATIPNIQLRSTSNPSPIGTGMNRHPTQNFNSVDLFDCLPIIPIQPLPTTVEIIENNQIILPNTQTVNQYIVVPPQHHQTNQALFWNEPLQNIDHLLPQPEPPQHHHQINQAFFWNEPLQNIDHLLPQPETPAIRPVWWNNQIPEFDIAEIRAIMQQYVPENVIQVPAEAVAEHMIVEDEEVDVYEDSTEILPNPLDGNSVIQRNEPVTEVETRRSRSRSGSNIIPVVVAQTRSERIRVPCEICGGLFVSGGGMAAHVRSCQTREVVE